MEGVDTPREKARLERVFAWLGLDMRFLGCFWLISGHHAFAERLRAASLETKVHAPQGLSIGDVQEVRPRVGGRAPAW